MKKFRIIRILFLGVVLASSVSRANTTSMSTYYPSPSGNYTKIHLMSTNGSPQTASFCQQESSGVFVNAGVIFADPATGYLEICKNDGSVASYPGSCFNRYASCPGGVCPAAACPNNYQVTNAASPMNFGNAIISWSCCFTGQGAAAGAAITKSGCFSTYSNTNDATHPALCDLVDSNAYDVGCDTIFSSDMASPVYKRNCCFNDSSGANALGVASTCCTPGTCPPAGGLGAGCGIDTCGFADASCGCSTGTCNASDKCVSCVPNCNLECSNTSYTDANNCAPNDCPMQTCNEATSVCNASGQCVLCSQNCADGLCHASNYSYCGQSCPANCTSPNTCNALDQCVLCIPKCNNPCSTTSYTDANNCAANDCPANCTSSNPSVFVSCSSASPSQCVQCIANCNQACSTVSYTDANNCTPNDCPANCSGTCSAGVCSTGGSCTPNCNMACSSGIYTDGCGGVCAPNCTGVCNSSGQCENCSSPVCSIANDGCQSASYTGNCGQSCPANCPAGNSCNAAGQCVSCSPMPPCSITTDGCQYTPYTDSCGQACPANCPFGNICTPSGQCESCLSSVCSIANDGCQTAPYTNGCGVSCPANCPSGSTCNESGQCESCASTVCSIANDGCQELPYTNGCGQNCPANCPGGSVCNASGQCVSCSPPVCSIANDYCDSSPYTGICGESCPANCNGTCDFDTPNPSGVYLGTCITCTPNCAGKSCGWDGCGGTCGNCSDTQTCDAASGQCVGCGCASGYCNVYDGACCTPNCSTGCYIIGYTDVSSGGCGEYCPPTCSSPSNECSVSGQCISCGSTPCSLANDGCQMSSYTNDCGQSCPANCASPDSCNASGQCVPGGSCVPNCADGQCHSSSYTDTNNCAVNDCPANCTSPNTCNAGQCVVCAPFCPDGQCHNSPYPDGCGGSCSTGLCSSPCTPLGQCTTGCIPNCNVACSTTSYTDSNNCAPNDCAANCISPNTCNASGQCIQG